MALNTGANGLGSTMAVALGMVYLCFLVYTSYFGYTEFKFKYVERQIKGWKTPPIVNVFRGSSCQPLLSNYYLGQAESDLNLSLCVQRGNCSYYDQFYKKCLVEGAHSLKFNELDPVIEVGASPLIQVFVSKEDYPCFSHTSDLSCAYQNSQKVNGSDKLFPDKSLFLRSKRLPEVSPECSYFVFKVVNLPSYAQVLISLGSLNILLGLVFEGMSIFSLLHAVQNKVDSRLSPWIMRSLFLLMFVHATLIAHLANIYWVLDQLISSCSLNDNDALFAFLNFKNHLWERLMVCVAGCVLLVLMLAIRIACTAFCSIPDELDQASDISEEERNWVINFEENNSQGDPQGEDQRREEGEARNIQHQSQLVLRKEERREERKQNRRQMRSRKQNNRDPEEEEQNRKEEEMARPLRKKIDSKIEKRKKLQLQNRYKDDEED